MILKCLDLGHVFLMWLVRGIAAVRRFFYVPPVTATIRERPAAKDEQRSPSIYQ